MCLYPQLIYNRKYTKTKKNGGKVPPLPLIEINGIVMEDERVKWVPVGCGKCMECLKKKSREWSVRLQEEIRHNNNGVFVTLTFSDESIKELSEEIPKEIKGYERDNAIAKIGVRRFLERWRKKYKKSVRHWLVTELGHNGTENIHLHGILQCKDKIEEIDKIWKYGFTWPRNTDYENNYVSERTINYITKYITKIDVEHKEYKPIILTSAGIGNGYLERTDAKNNKYIKGKTKEQYRTRQGAKLGLPIYYRNQIYTEEEREQLWIEKLDEQVRYVNGEKVSIKNGDKEYYKLLNYHRARNKELGYGNNEKNWDRKRYEDSKRNLKHKQRVWRANKEEAEKADKERKKLTKSRWEKIKESLDLKECPF